MVKKSNEKLSNHEHSCYNEIIRFIESYQSEWVFFNISFDTVFKVYKTVLDHHPEYFWLSGKCSGTTKTHANGSVLSFKPEFEYDLNQIPKNRQLFNHTVDTLVNAAKEHTSSVYEQILFLHDYLVLHTDYVLNAAHCYDAYGCLVSHKAVCAGYAAAFQVLMRKIGVLCGRTSGWSKTNLTGDFSHVWNYIKLSDGYYYIDVTWDDPVVSGETVRDNLSYDYFCLDSWELQLTHKIEPGQFIPQYFGKKYNYYRYRGWCLNHYSYPDVKSLAIKQLQHSDCFVIKFSSKTDTDNAINDLFGNQKVFSISGLNNKISYSVSKSGLVLKIIKGIV